MDAYIQTETPTRNYDLEIAAQVPFAEKAKERYELAQAKLNKLREHAMKREAELQKLLEERTTKSKHPGNSKVRKNGGSTSTGVSPTLQSN